jgi:hypothetical protein
MDGHKRGKEVIQKGLDLAVKEEVLLLVITMARKTS